ncbi:MAG: efflux RND transporter periplasmic adaptor subunit [Thermoguttaceae bacterium]|jgi:membrane fusion protein (multidrug efflux system)
MLTPRLPRKRLLLIGGSCAVFAASAVIFWQTRRSAEAAPTAQTTYFKTIGPHETPSAKAAARDLRKQSVEAVERNLTLRLTGSLAADDKSEVGSNAAGNVSETRVDRGSFVKKGDVLVQIDPRDAQNALDEGVSAAEELRVRLGLDESKEFCVDEVPEVEAAKIAMDLAERSFHRSENLKKQNAIALETYDQSATEYHAATQRYYLTRRLAKQLNRSYRSAVTHLATLRKAVDDCTIRAPMDGWVAERNISVGERIIALFPGAKLVTLLRINPLRLTLTVPQQEMAQIKVGQIVTFRTDAFPGRLFTGAIRYISPAVTCDNRSLCVEAVIPNPNAELLPGLFATAELQLDKKHTELYVPVSAVCNRGDVAAVYVVRGGTVREQIVSLGDRDGARVRVLTGLAGGDVVATAPDGLHDGDTVQ